MIRKAEKFDTARVAEIYGLIIDGDCGNESRVCWQKGVYPTIVTAEEALSRGDLFVMTEGGDVTASAIINQIQPEAYRECAWSTDARDDEIMVLHTLCVDPSCAGRGFGKRFVAFYENYAAENGCRFLRMDTNAKNTNARRMYKKLGYTEAGIVRCDFNGIKNIELVCLEKNLF